MMAFKQRIGRISNPALASGDREPGRPGWTGDPRAFDWAIRQRVSRGGDGADCEGAVRIEDRQDARPTRWFLASQQPAFLMTRFLLLAACLFLSCVLLIPEATAPAIAAASA